MPNEFVTQLSYILYKIDGEEIKINVLLKEGGHKAVL